MEVFEDDFEKIDRRRCPIVLSHAEFPSSHTVMETCSMPFGLTISPFLDTADLVDSVTPADSVPRCKSCSAYMCPLCSTESTWWQCLLCGEDNTFSRSLYQVPRVRGRSAANMSIVEHPIDIPHPRKSFLRRIQRNGSSLTSLETEKNSSKHLATQTVFAPSFIPPPPTQDKSFDEAKKRIVDIAPARSASPVTDTSYSFSTLAPPVHMRPLVNVFLLPDRMHVEVLEVVIDSLIAAIRSAMHPEVQVVLLSYSNKISVYPLSLVSVRRPEDETYLEDSRIPVLYASFLPPEDQELRDAQEAFFDELDGRVELTRDTYVSLDENGVAYDDEDGGLLDYADYRSLNDVADFHRLASPLSTCGVALFEALEAFSERCLSSERATALANSDAEAALRTVLDWILRYPDAEPGAVEDTDSRLSSKGLDNNVGEEEADEDDDADANEGPGLWRGIRSWLGLSEGRGRGLLKESNGGLGRGGPIDDCSGVVVHAFLTREDKLLSLDPTAPSYKQSWVAETADECARRGVSVNMWAVVGSAHQQTNASALAALSSRSGGALRRIALSGNAPMKRSQLTEQLRREFSSPLATRCLFKLRTSPVVAVDAVNGHLISAPDLPGVYHMGACPCFGTVGALVDYSDATGLSPLRGTKSRENKQFVSFQVAFSYDSVMEDPAGRVLWSRSEGKSGEQRYADMVSDTFGMLRTAEELEESSGRSSRGSDGSTLLRPLLAVRRLRVITVLVECTDSVPRLVEGCEPTAIAAVMVRQALYITPENKGGSAGGKKPSRSSMRSLVKKASCGRANASVGLLDKWIGQLVAGALRQSISAASVGNRVRLRKSTDEPVYLRALDRIVADTAMLRLLRLLFGALDLFSRGALAAKESIVADNVHYCTDDFAELAAAALQIDPDSLCRLMYPALCSLESNLLVSSSSLYLRRQAMVAAGAAFYFCDSGGELVLYRSLQARGAAVGSEFSVDVLANERHLSRVIGRRLRTHALVPLVFMAQSGKESARRLERLLIEDASGAGLSFKDFMDYFKKRAIELVD